MTKKRKSRKKKKEIRTERILLGVFIVLLILVIVLGVMVFQKNKEAKSSTNANISVPVFKVGSEENISLSVKALSLEDEYILKITNKMKEKVNKEEIIYDLVIENSSDCKIKITKNHNKKNLMVDQKTTKIEGEKLKKDNLDEVFYHIEITDSKKISDDDKINIKIVS